MELTILRWIQYTISHPIWIEVFRLITVLGNSGIVWLVFASALVIRRRYRVALFLVLGLLLTSLAVDVLMKPLMMRPRPFVSDSILIPRIPPPVSWSFPSGHSATSMCCGFFLLQTEKNRFGMVAFFLGILICLSRLVLLVHYPTDVLAGALIGMTIGWYMFRLMRKAQGNQKLLGFAQKVLGTVLGSMKSRDPKR